MDLLTDGVVDTSQVNELAKLADTMDFIQVPVVFLISGCLFSAPENTDISVGIPFFASAQEALILFKDYMSGQIFVVDAKGAFEPLKTTQTERKLGHGDLLPWNLLPVNHNEVAFCNACAELGVDFEHDPEQRTRKSISLGPQWASAIGNALINVSKLLEQGHLAISDLQNLLRDEAINQLALYARRVARLRGCGIFSFVTSNRKL